jgi:hypothetical protein
VILLLVLFLSTCFAAGLQILLQCFSIFPKRKSTRTVVNTGKKELHVAVIISRTHY